MEHRRADSCRPLIPALRWWQALALIGWVIALPVGSATAAELAPEPLNRVNTLPATPDPHWLWVYDMVYDYMTDGRASLIDGDSGRFLGMLSTGYSFTQLTLPRHHREIYSAETYYSRYTRGQRDDVVSIYSPTSLSPIGEIDIPDKRASTIPTPHNAVLTDDDRFMLIFNLTPATSVSVVDLPARRFVGEIETPGCSLIYPTGPRRFFSLCGDGSLLAVELDESGAAVSATRSQPFFDPEGDPLSEKGVRANGRWHFVSFDGLLYRVDARTAVPEFSTPVPLLSASERADGWRIGGVRHLAVHAASGRLFSIVHRGGGQETRKDPGRHIWVYDLASLQRRGVIETRADTGLIALTQDAAPLLFTADVARNAIDVYAADSGEFLRSVEQIGYTPTGIETPVAFPPGQ